LKLYASQSGRPACVTAARTLCSRRTPRRTAPWPRTRRRLRRQAFPDFFALRSVYRSVLVAFVRVFHETPRQRRQPTQERLDIQPAQEQLAAARRGRSGWNSPRNSWTTLGSNPLTPEQVQTVRQL